MPTMTSGPPGHPPAQLAADVPTPPTPPHVSASGAPDSSTTISSNVPSLELVHLSPAYVMHEPEVSVLKPLIEDGTFYQFKDMVTEVIHNLDHILDDAQGEVSDSRSSSVSYVPSCSNISFQLSTASSTFDYRDDYDYDDDDDDYSDFEDDDEQDVFGDDEQQLEEDSDEDTSSVDSRHTMIDNLKAQFETNLHQQLLSEIDSSPASSALSSWSTSSSRTSTKVMAKPAAAVIDIETEAQQCLDLWLTRSSNCLKESTPTESCTRKLMNPLLPNMTDNLCLRPELSDRLVLYPEARLPFRRTLSELNLASIGIEDQHKQNKNPGKYDFLVNTITPAATPEPNTDPIPLSRQRSRSSLTMFHKSRLLGKRSGGDSLTPPTQRDRFNLNLAAHLQTDAAQLASKSALAGNAVRFAQKLSKLQKKYYLAITPKDVMGLIFRRHPERSPGLSLMLRFGQEVSQLVADRVRTEFTVDSQARMIAYFIEVAVILCYHRNYQSFQSVMRGLALPQVYRLVNAWARVKQQHSIHFRLYTFSTHFLTYKSRDLTILSHRGASLPMLETLVATFSARLIMLWDQLETNEARTKRRGYGAWREPPGVVAFLAANPVDRQTVETQLAEREHQFVLANLKRWNKTVDARLVRRYVRDRLSKTEKGWERNMKRARKEKRNERLRSIDETTLGRLTEMLRRDCRPPDELFLPTTWERRSLRHLGIDHQIALHKEFGQLYEQLMSQVMGSFTL